MRDYEDQTLAAVNNKIIVYGVSLHDDSYDTCIRMACYEHSTYMYDACKPCIRCMQSSVMQYRLQITANNCSLLNLTFSFLSVYRI